MAAWTYFELQKVQEDSQTVFFYRNTHNDNFPPMHQLVFFKERTEVLH